MTEESGPRGTGRCKEFSTLALTVAPMRPAKSAYPLLHDLAPSGPSLTPYDRAHFLTYARLIDAEREGVDWREAARTILLRASDEPDDATRQCWQSHLERAHAILAGSIEGFEPGD